MDKTFDDLFNEFFKRNNIKPEDKLSDEVKNKVTEMLNMLTNFKDTTSTTEEKEKEMDERLGKPDKVDYFNEGDVFFERRIWHTPNGDIQKLVFSKDPTLILAPKPEKSLQQKLDAALEVEDFEQAALIRDEMKRSKKIIKKTK